MGKKSVLLGLVVAGLWGCADKPPVDPLPVINPVAGGEAAEDAALEVNQVRQKYDECIRKLSPKAPACLDLQWQYDDAKSQYDAIRAPKPRP